MKDMNPLVRAGMNVIKDMTKELTGFMNRAERDTFKASMSNAVKVSKENLVYKDGFFITPTANKRVKNSGSLDSYVKSNLPSGEKNAEVGFYFFETGVFNLGFVRLNPLASESETDYFIEVEKEHSYLSKYISPEFLQRYVKKHAHFLFPTVLVEPVEMPNMNELNQLLAEGKIRTVELNDEDVELMGLPVDGLKIDEFTQRRILDKGILVDKNLVNFGVKK